MGNGNRYNGEALYYNNVYPKVVASLSQRRARRWSRRKGSGATIEQVSRKAAESAK